MSIFYCSFSTPGFRSYLWLEQYLDPKSTTRNQLQSKRQFFSTGILKSPGTIQQYSQLSSGKGTGLSSFGFSFTYSTGVGTVVNFLIFFLLASIFTLISTCYVKFLFVFGGPILFLIIRYQQRRKEFQRQTTTKNKLRWSA